MRKCWGEGAGSGIDEIKLIRHKSGYLRLQAFLTGVGLGFSVAALTGRMGEWGLVVVIAGMFLMLAGSDWLLLEQRRLDAVEEQARAAAWAELVGQGQAVRWLLSVGYTIAKDEAGLYLVSPDGQEDFAAEEFDGLAEEDLAKVYYGRRESKGTRSGK